MAIWNFLLSIGAYCLGFVVLFSYPFYFGVESPIDIILTPIGLVFVLEMDNWAYNVWKNFYPEAHMRHLWEFKLKSFQWKSYDYRNRSIWMRFLFVIGIFWLICGVTTFIKMEFDRNNETSNLVINARNWAGAVSIFFIVGVVIISVIIQIIITSHGNII